MNIIQAIESPQQLGSFIEDQSTFSAWKTLLRAAFALPEEPGDLELYQKHTGRSEWPQEQFKELWIAAGVRSGKTAVSSLLAVFLACFHKPPKLSKGELGYILIIAPTRSQAQILKRYISGIVNSHKVLRRMIVNETKDSIEFSNGIAVTTLSSDFRSIRGRTSIANICDEVAFINQEGSRTDTEVIRALRSRGLTTNAPLICISSPYSKSGQLYEAYRNHFGKDNDPIFVWHSPSMVLNPTLDEESIERQLKEDPEAARNDYLAEWRDGISSYVDRAAVEACIYDGRYELPRVRGTIYHGFVDPAGGSGSDSFTLAISHKSRDQMLLDVVREVPPPFSPDDTVKEFSDLLKSYGCFSVTGDRYTGDWCAERFQKHGINYQPSSMTKTQLYQNFLPLVNGRKCVLLDNQTLIKQLCNLERIAGRSGKETIDHPPRQHDDLINSVAGSMTAATQTLAAGTWEAGVGNNDTPWKTRSWSVDSLIEACQKPSPLLRRK